MKGISKGAKSNKDSKLAKLHRAGVGKLLGSNSNVMSRLRRAEAGATNARRRAKAGRGRQK